MEALTRQPSSELPGSGYWSDCYFDVSMTKKQTIHKMSSTRVHTLLLLGGILVFLGCGILSKSDQLQNNPTSPSPESSQQSAEEVDAVRLISGSVESNKLNVNSSDLKAKKNPNGVGVFVYVPQTRFNGIERYVIWMVIDSKGYALNSPSKMVTPSLPWSRDADEATWNKTGINRFNGASEAIEFLFGK